MKQFIQIFQRNLAYSNKFACLSQLPALGAGYFCYINSYNRRLQFIPAAATTIALPAFAEFAKIYSQYHALMGNESDSERGSGRIGQWLMGNRTREIDYYPIPNP
jgi:hypothetical protein